MVLNILGQIIGFVGSLCLLLFGMNMLSDGIQKGAGSGLQKLVSKITRNRLFAILTGIGVTALIQSSGATTVMVVSFVNAEILSLEQAIGVIFGIDHVLDMFRTAVNVTGDAICTMIVAFKNKSFDVDVFKGRKKAEKKVENLI